MSEILKVSEDGLYRVRLVVDEDCETPREPDSLSHVVTVPSSRYVNVDKTGGPLGDGWDRIKDRPDAMDLFERWARTFHGAITLRDTPERGANAIWYLMPDHDATDPADYLECERRVYREWAEGEAYGYVIEEQVTRYRITGDDPVSTWEPDSGESGGWGLIGFDYARTTALDAFDQFINSQEK